MEGIVGVLGHLGYRDRHPEYLAGQAIVERSDNVPTCAGRTRRSRSWAGRRSHGRLCPPARTRGSQRRRNPRQPVGPTSARARVRVGLTGAGQHSATEDNRVTALMFGELATDLVATRSKYTVLRLPFGAEGVPTQISETSLAAIASATSVVARKVPESTTSAISSPIRSSTTGVRPRAIRSTLIGLTSTPMTSCPLDAKHAAETEPT